MTPIKKIYCIRKRVTIVSTDKRTPIVACENAMATSDFFQYSDFSTGEVTVVTYDAWAEKQPESDGATHKYAHRVLIRTGDRPGVVLERGCFFEHVDRDVQTASLWRLADIVTHGSDKEPHIRAQRVVVFEHNELFISNYWDTFTKDKVCRQISDIRQRIDVPDSLDKRDPYWWNNGRARLETMYTRDCADEGSNFFLPPKWTLTASELQCTDTEFSVDRKPANSGSRIRDAAMRAFLGQSGASPGDGANDTETDAGSDQLLDLMMGQFMQGVMSNLAGGETEHTPVDETDK